MSRLCKEPDVNDKLLPLVIVSICLFDYSKKRSCGGLVSLFYAVILSYEECACSQKCLLTGMVADLIKFLMQLNFSLCYLWSAELILVTLIFVVEFYDNVGH